MSINGHIGGSNTSIHDFPISCTCSYSCGYTFVFFSLDLHVPRSLFVFHCLILASFETCKQKYISFRNMLREVESTFELCLMGGDDEITNASGGGSGWDSGWGFRFRLFAGSFLSLWSLKFLAFRSLSVWYFIRAVGSNLVLYIYNVAKSFNRCENRWYSETENSKQALRKYYTILIDFKWF